jgi:hypothetical protein
MAVKYHQWLFGCPVMRYLILAKSDAIPAVIMNLAPGGDAEEAFDAYFVAMRRGYMTTPVASPTLN